MAEHSKSKRHSSKPTTPTAGKQGKAPVMVRNKVSRDAAEEAVRTLLRWTGDNPERERVGGPGVRSVTHPGDDQVKPRVGRIGR